MTTFALDAQTRSTPSYLSGPTYDQLSTFAQTVVARDKQEGMKLAVWSRWAALTVVGFLTFYLNPRLEVIYYLAILVGFGLIGWAQLKVGRAGRSRPELLLIICDLTLLTVTLTVPNPFREYE